jgi:SAM-dependent methyltransferase
MLRGGTVVADIGSGTGLLAELFLRAGYDVMAVEPNTEMRQAGERRLGGLANFHSIAGRAEATTLPDRSIDLVVVGTAFHWFDREAARREFVRILRPDGHAMIVWNQRDQAESFMRDYESLVERHATDYRDSRARRAEEQFAAQFFAPGWITRSFAHSQTLDYDGLANRLLSSSYAPQDGHPDHLAMMKALKTLFDEHAQDGRVRFEYRAVMYAGRLTA